MNIFPDSRRRRSRTSSVPRIIEAEIDVSSMAAIAVPNYEQHSVSELGSAGISTAQAPRAVPHQIGSHRGADILHQYQAPSSKYVVGSLVQQTPIIPTPPPAKPSNYQASRSSSLKTLIQTPSSILAEDQHRFLQNDFHFPSGLATELGKTRSLFPARFWILDNSGSMLNNDGEILTPQHERVTCTRWKELQETVNYHSELAALLQATTHFRLLNDPGVRVGPQEFSIAATEGRGSIRAEVADVQDILHRTKPFGSTPLTGHLREVAAQISVVAPTMHQKGLQAVVIIATDGLPTSSDGGTSDEINNDFIVALQQLQTLPVWVVIRLCTDEQAVVDFYNSLDTVLELPLEVLDDHVHEAKEIQKVNPWLNYALPLHRCREIGYQHRIFDLLDERPLNKDEIRDFCHVLLGREYFINAPDVHADWNGFCKVIVEALKLSSDHWNPLTNKMQPWIDMGQLKRAFGGGLRGIFKKKKR